MGIQHEDGCVDTRLTPYPQCWMDEGETDSAQMLAPVPSGRDGWGLCCKGGLPLREEGARARADAGAAAGGVHGDLVGSLVGVGDAGALVDVLDPGVGGVVVERHLDGHEVSPYHAQLAGLGSRGAPLLDVVGGKASDGPPTGLCCHCPSIGPRPP